MLPILFNFEGQELRTILTDGEPEFCAKDVCEMIDVDSSQTRRLDDDEKGLCLIQTHGGTQELLFVTEPGLYSLILGSRKPEAKVFKRWITHEVIPSIRKTGSYAPQQMSQAEILAGLAQVTVEIERKANTALEVANKASRQITNALDIFTAPIDRDWRQAMNSKMRGICQEYGLSYLMFYHDLYEELENLARVNLQARLTRLRARLQGQGATKTACKAITKLEVIERDPKLKPIFEGIVRKYQAKYAVA
jgi:prophage antirepressor-like protein